MPDTFSFEEPEVIATLEESPRLAEPDTPFRIALMGDWSGRANRHLSTEKFGAEEREPIPIDRDDFDEVMARLGVSLRLTLAGEGGSHFTLRFQELDDFHPDRIFERVELFDALRRMRERLEDDSTFAEAAREMRDWSSAKETAQAEDSPDRQAVPASASGGSLLEQMLEEAGDIDEQPATQASVSSHADDELRALLRDAVRPYLVSTDEAEQAELIASVDEATSRLMRSILHDADFQSLESAWRALYLLVSRLETGTDLKLYLIDMTKEEMAASLSDELEASAIHKLLVDKSVNTFGGDLWAVIVGNYIFDATREDTRMLERLGKIARRAGAPFISASSSRVLGCDSLAATPDPDDWHSELDAESRKGWDALRHSPESAYLGLALPRFLLRLPYGAETEPLEQFGFEELTEKPAHENYLWGNPAFACALLLGQAFTEYGWDMQPGILPEIEGLPLHVFEDEGDAYIKPCAETLLTMRAVERILEEGLMPLVSFQGRDVIRVARFQSLSAHEPSLHGRWS
jgi:type VI secretion system protein ImpC